jgi:hypothetical protein
MTYPASTAPVAVDDPVVLPRPVDRLRLEHDQAQLTIGVPASLVDGVKQIGPVHHRATSPTPPSLGVVTLATTIAPAM